MDSSTESTPCMTKKISLSEIALSLSPESKSHYVKKVDDIGLGPYLVNSKRWNYKNLDESLPDLSFADIFAYLVLKESTYSHEQFRNWKSLEAYNQAYNGFVSDVCTFRPGDSEGVIISSKVLHSQKLSEKPLRPWVFVNTDGAAMVETAHCNCMAGLGESCTHVAAILFYVEGLKRLKEKTTVTGKSAYWKVPPGQAVAITGVNLFQGMRTTHCLCRSTCNCATGQECIPASKQFGYYGRCRNLA